MVCQIQQFSLNLEIPSRKFELFSFVLQIRYGVENVQAKLLYIPVKIAVIFIILFY